MVSAGYMGKKSGKGFFDYGLAPEEKPIAIPGQMEGEAKDTESPAPYGESETRA
jgi:3-hydroxyacyl-CoA dehydrogenase